ncbi:MAG: response regulator transcription factor [Mucilaginibacter polytrichastri]|nr:response regulator transcription factor [Mucilaginibacter polytrichastri]
MKVLVVEDSADLAASIRDFLSGENYIVEVAPDYSQACEKLLFYAYDCIVLDIMLPDGNGLDLLNHIKKQHLKSNVLIISAKDALDDKIEGLEKGADDYITKPFHLSELHARLRAIYRRNRLDGDQVVSFNEISLNTDTLEARVHNGPLNVTAKEFELLLYFVVNKSRVLSRHAIATHLWGDYTDNLANYDFIYQHVKNLRKKISMLGGRDYIETVYGLGYRFNTEKEL